MRMIKRLDISHNIRQLMSNWGLLIILCFTIFVLPLLTGFIRFRLFEIFISLIVLISTVATSEEGKPKVLFQVLIAFVAIWITRIADLEVINYLATLWLVVFFMLRVLKFIRRLSTKEDVNSLVIIEAINGYLLIGVGFGILIDMVTYRFAGAFNFGEATQINHIYDSFYYTFVSMTTLGYGDLLPVTPVAKSLALMITLSGQFYLVIIMALLVGRMLTSSDRKG
ncbi:ion channel [Carboxylicivirga sp. RSCT41]|uniref:ion channel n=1 Tax=Carboxylicivirga agarovorans TaxID=3417570 RepID=UPI003D32D631